MKNLQFRWLNFYTKVHKIPGNIRRSYQECVFEVCTNLSNFPNLDQFQTFRHFFGKFSEKKSKIGLNMPILTKNHWKNTVFYDFSTFLKTSLKFWKKSSYRGAHKVGDRVKIYQKFFRIFEKVKKNIGSKYFCKLPLIWFNYRGNKID